MCFGQVSNSPFPFKSDRAIFTREKWDHLPPYTQQILRESHFESPETTPFDSVLWDIHEEEIEARFGRPEPAHFATIEEWNALSDKEQEAEWEEFHDRCARGTADDMYFYRIMMDTHLIGYVGH